MSQSGTKGWRAPVRLHCHTIFDVEIFKQTETKGAPDNHVTRSETRQPKVSLAEDPCYEYAAQVFLHTITGLRIQSVVQIHQMTFNAPEECVAGLEEWLMNQMTFHSDE
ncbi:hypothetical protein X801_00833 [Opisthorchis viverrini]|uniref:Uncharacterized protein n=2 Tax=Opisthorchis viverrini TaxID=6198 RepID=A0A1S8X979_OPIVI|nr:hypothetical protein T265_01408 [Opisthorchis viverrini]KER32531.1 hypothetical protein T265_01408 [Opisthorchis viverrini]OON23259.1 hypothetical protein X801_00833 [Opisthorchis viverrini]